MVRSISKFLIFLILSTVVFGQSDFSVVDRDYLMMSQVPDPGEPGAPPVPNTTTTIGNRLFYFKNTGAFYMDELGDAHRFCVDDDIACGSTITLPENITGPSGGTHQNNRVPLFDGIDTWVLKDSGYAFPTSPGTTGDILQLVTADVADWVPPPISLPDDASQAGKILTSDGTNNADWINSGILGQILTQGVSSAEWADSPVSLPPDLGIEDNVLLSDGADNGKWLGTGPGNQVLFQRTDGVVEWADLPNLSNVTADFYRGRRFSAFSTNNTTAILFEDVVQHDFGRCGQVTDSVDEGTFITITAGNCLFMGTFTFGQSGGAVEYGATLDPDGLELSMPYADLPRTKKLCMDTLLGFDKNINTCTFLHKGSAGEKIYFQGPINTHPVNNPDDFGLVLSAFATGFGTAVTGGDVTGPSSSVDGNIATYDGTTGKLIMDSGVDVAQVTMNEADIVTLDATVTTHGLDIGSNTVNIGINTTNIGTNTTNIGTNTTNITTNTTDIANRIVGPALATDLAFVQYDGVTGKLARNSSLTEEFGGDIQARSTFATFDAGFIATNDSDTKTGSYRFSNLLMSSINGTGSLRLQPHVNTNNTLSLTFPLVGPGNNQILESDTGGNLTWVNTPDDGDVTGPVSSTNNFIPLWDGASGKLLKNQTFATINPTNGDIRTDGGINLGFGTSTTGLIFLQDNDNSSTLTFKAHDTMTSSYTTTMPASPPLVSNILQSDASGNLTWITTPAGGDVTGPAGATDEAVALFDGATGKLIKSDSLNFFAPNRLLSGMWRLQLNGFATAAGHIDIFDLDNTNSIDLTVPDVIPTDYTITLPAAAPANNNILESDATGNLSWTATPTGDVAGPASSIDNGIPRFDGVTGKLLQSSVVTLNDGGIFFVNSTFGGIFQTATAGSQFDLDTSTPGNTAEWRLGRFSNATDLSFAVHTPGSPTERFRVDTNGVEISDAYILPTADGSANQFMTTDGAGTASWGNPPGNVSGPNSPFSSTIGRVPTWADQDGTVLKADNWLQSRDGGIVVFNTGLFSFTHDIVGTDYQINMNLAGEMQFHRTGVERMSITAPGNIQINNTYTLPLNDGTVGQALVTDGAGTVDWETFGNTYDPSITSTLNLNVGNVFYRENFANASYTFSNFNNGQTAILVVLNTSGSNNTVSLGAGKWSGGVAVTVILANSTNMYTITRVNNIFHFTAVEDMN